MTPPWVERAAAAPEVERALKDLDGLGASLVESYRALEARAARVEQELAVSNAALACKVAELEELASRMRALDRLAALGRMAGGIAHELRNPMHAIGGFAALLAERLEPGSRERTFAARISEAVADANGVLASMLGLCSREPLALETLDALEVARAARAIALEEAGDAAGARWTIDLRGPAAPLVGDRIKLRQALRNLLANAIQVLPDGGRIAVAVARHRGSVAFAVEDSGPGFPREIAARALEPFFTTRAEGTGLGLALARSIAELHGGRIEIDERRSELGGARVTLRIPDSSPAR
jgi:signal transduction histidine kinase